LVKLFPKGYFWLSFSQKVIFEGRNRYMKKKIEILMSFYTEDNTPTQPKQTELDSKLSQQKLNNNNNRLNFHTNQKNGSLLPTHSYGRSPHPRLHAPLARLHAPLATRTSVHTALAHSARTRSGEGKAPLSRRQGKEAAGNRSRKATG
jgi:hypothetical protein